MLTYSVQASAPPTGGSQTLSVALNGAAPTVGPLAGGFTCNVGDAVVLTATNVSASGVSGPPSAPFAFTAADTLVPSAPSITGVTLVSD